MTCPCPTPLEFQWRENGHISVVSSSGNYASFTLFRKGGRAGDNWIFFGPVKKIFKKNRRKAGTLVHGRKIFQSRNMPGSENYGCSRSIRPGACPCLSRGLPLTRVSIAGPFAEVRPCPTPLSTARPLPPSANPRNTAALSRYPGVIPSRYPCETPPEAPAPAIYPGVPRDTLAILESSPRDTATGLPQENRLLRYTWNPPATHLLYPGNIPEPGTGLGLFRLISI